MSPRGTRGAYRKEERAKLPPLLQKELVEKAAARHGNCQELAKALDIPKSSVHYYRTGRLTIPVSLLDMMLREAGDPDLDRRVREATETLDRTWANYYSSGINREICRQRVRLPTLHELERDHELRRKAAAVVSYVMAEGSVWMQKEMWGEAAANITFAEHETDLYEHFRGLVLDVFDYDIGPPQAPGNGAKAIRGFIYSRFIAEWLVQNGVSIGDKSAQPMRLPGWVMTSDDRETWISALQPWLDGEGCVTGPFENGRRRGFVLTQARHTDLDLNILPRPHACGASNRHLGRNAISSTSVFGIPVIEYCSALSRSEVLTDVALLINRLGLQPRTRLSNLHLKDDGFWSCTWIVRIPSSKTRWLTTLGLIRQGRKLKKLLGYVEQ